MSSKLDYLKKYGGGDGGQDKKKRKKKPQLREGGIRIVDEDTDRGRIDMAKIEERWEKDNVQGEDPVFVDAAEEEEVVVATIGTWETVGNDSTLSRQRNGNDSKDNSPVRRKKPASSEDNSPPRRRQRHSSPDISPLRRRRHDSPKAVSPARQDLDSSPPRRRRRNDSNDETTSSTRKREHSPQHDSSPPRRRKRHDSPDGASRPSGRASQASRVEDSSPPRRRRHDSSAEDSSPPRRKRDRHGGSVSRINDEEKQAAGKEDSTVKTSSGYTAGLQSGKDFKVVEEALRKKQQEELSAMAESGKGQETIYRDKKGRKMDMLTEFMRQQDIREGKAVSQAKAEYEWGRGKVQKEDDEKHKKELEHIKLQPFARSVDYRDEELKAVVRAEDPMAAYIKPKKVDSSKPVKPIYKGPLPRPNRFGIRPGYRWDGIDRGNGWEDKLIETEAKRRDTTQKQRQWSQSDM